MGLINECVENFATLATILIYHYFMQFSFFLSPANDCFGNGWRSTRFLMLIAVLRYLYYLRFKRFHGIEEVWGHFVIACARFGFRFLVLEVLVSCIWCQFEVFVNKFVFMVLMNSDPPFYRVMHGDLITNIVLFGIAFCLLCCILERVEYFGNCLNIYGYLCLSDQQDVPSWIRSSFDCIKTKSSGLAHRVNTSLGNR